MFGLGIQVLKDREVLLAHFDFPADREVHLRATNAFESTFAPVRLRTRKTKGAGSRTAGLAVDLQSAGGSSSALALRQRSQAQPTRVGRAASTGDCHS